MAGRTGSIRPDDPRAGDSLPEDDVQRLDLAGHAQFPANSFETRAASKLLKGNNVRVFSDALDGNWSVWMSKANAVQSPKYATGRELWSTNDCNLTSEQLVPNMRSVMNLTLFGSPSRRSKPRQTTGNDGADGVLSGAWERGSPRSESRGSTCGGSLPPKSILCRRAGHKRGQKSWR